MMCRKQVLIFRKILPSLTFFGSHADGHTCAFSEMANISGFYHISLQTKQQIPQTVIYVIVNQIFVKITRKQTIRSNREYLISVDFGYIRIGCTRDFYHVVHNDFDENKKTSSHNHFNHRQNDYVQILLLYLMKCRTLRLAMIFLIYLFTFFTARARHVFSVCMAFDYFCVCVCFFLLGQALTRLVTLIIITLSSV